MLMSEGAKERISQGLLSLLSLVSVGKTRREGGIRRRRGSQSDWFGMGCIRNVED